MNGKQFKNLVFERLAQAAKALGDPRRLQIVEMVMQAPKPVEQLVLDVDLPLATVSHHLQILKQAGIVTSQKQGRRVVYSQTELGRDLFTELCAAGEAHIGEIRMAIRDFFGNDDVESSDERQVMKKIREGDAVLIDVRPRGEYDAGHIPGAISIPMKEMEKRMKSIPRSKDVFAYCRGRYCVLSHEAVKSLRKKGFRILRLNRGPLDFQARGIALDLGPARAEGARS